tara:strand:+ start:29 stop:238 length:210 start_codon:yes stop_codon:yes gene_type:complete
MKNLTGLGLFSGVALWLVLVSALAFRMRCLDRNTCEPSDFIMFAIMALGLIVPAAITAKLISFSPRKSR